LKNIKTAVDITEDCRNIVENFNFIAVFSYLFLLISCLSFVLALIIVTDIIAKIVSVFL